jgi:hypothetical protein
LFVRVRRESGVGGRGAKTNPDVLAARAGLVIGNKRLKVQLKQESKGAVSVRRDEKRGSVGSAADIRGIEERMGSVELGGEGGV